MNVDDLRVLVRDRALNMVGVVDPMHLAGAMFAPRDGDVGAWRIVLPEGLDATRALMTPGAGIIVYQGSDFFMSGVMVSHKSVETAEGTTVTISGVTDETILDGIGVYPDPADADPTGQNRDPIELPAGASIPAAAVGNQITMMPTARKAGLRAFLDASGLPNVADAQAATFRPFGSLLDLGKRLLGQDGTRFLRARFDPDSKTIRVEFAGRLNRHSSFSSESGLPLWTVATGELQEGEVQRTAPTVTRQIVAGENAIVVADDTVAADEWGVPRDAMTESSGDVDTLQQEALEQLQAVRDGFTVTPRDNALVDLGGLVGSRIAVLVGGEVREDVLHEVTVTVDASGVAVSATLGNPSAVSWEDMTTERIGVTERRVERVSGRMGDAQRLVDSSLADLDTRLDDAEQDLAESNGRLAEAESDIANMATPIMEAAAPTGSDTAPEGTIWFQVNGSGDIIGQWEQTAGGIGATWARRDVESQVIANLDVGKLTASEAEMDGLVAQKIAAESGQFIDLDVAQLYATEATIEQGVIEKLFADVVVAQTAIAGEFIGNNAIINGTISTQKLTIGDFSNLVDDPNFEFTSEGAWGMNPGVSIVATSEGRAVRVDADDPNVAGAAGAYNALNFSCMPGDSLSVKFRAISNMNGACIVQIRWFDENRALLSTSNLSVPSTAPAATWDNYSFNATAPASAHLGQFVLRKTLGATTGRFHVTNPQVRRMMSGELLVDGAIDGTTITGALIQTASSGKRIQLTSGPDFNMYDRNNKMRGSFQMATSADDPSFFFLDPDGTTRALYGSDGIYISDSSGAPAVQIDPNGGANVKDLTARNAIWDGDAKGVFTSNVVQKVNAGPWAVAAGMTGVSNLGAGAAFNLTATFPAGRFSVAPIIQATTTSTNAHAHVTARSSTQCTIRVHNTAPSNTQSFDVMWTATQMTSGNGAG